MIKREQYYLSIDQVRANYPKVVGLRLANQKTFNQTSTITNSLGDGTK